MTSRHSVLYNVYDVSMNIVYTGTESEIVNHFNWDMLRVRWGIYQVECVYDMYIVRADEPRPDLYIQKYEMLKWR